MAETVKGMKDAVMGQGGNYPRKTSIAVVELNKTLQVACKKLQQESAMRLQRIQTLEAANRRSQTRHPSLSDNLAKVVFFFQPTSTRL